MSAEELDTVVIFDLVDEFTSARADVKSPNSSSSIVKSSITSGVIYFEFRGYKLSIINIKHIFHQSTSLIPSSGDPRSLLSKSNALTSFEELIVLLRN